MRGLKLETAIKGFNECLVASFTDAWIETPTLPGLLPVQSVASFTDAWIETGGTPKPESTEKKSHLLQMRGLKLNGKKTYNRWISRIFYRCVD